MSDPFFLTQGELDDYERSKRGEPARGPSGASRSYPDSGDEPEAICANCDSWLGSSVGRWCSYTNLIMEPNDHCKKFFPDPVRWPDADHD